MRRDSLLLISVLVVLCSSALLARAFLHSHHGVQWQESTDLPTWVDQKLDHFNPSDTRTFKQRYWVDSTHWGGKTSPVFMYICGEAECGGIPSGYLVEMAIEFRGLIVVLEHRYYGASVPFTDLSTENLAWLNSKQALYDLAYFHLFITNNMGVDPSAKWVSVGGSYPGALSAWFRLKFPHLVAASWSSSGVVNAVLDFTDFDRQIATSAGVECAAALRNATAAIEQLLASPTTNASTKQLFAADPTDFADDGDFYYLLADSGALAFQYGYPDAVCKPMVQAARSGGDLVQAFATYTKSFFLPTFCAGVGARSYSTPLQASIATTPARNERQWWWQTCAELAYWQNAPATNSIRSKYLNMDYHRRHCKAVFGTDIWPNTVDTNNYYGATNVQQTNIFFANASQDPWQWASVRNTLSPTEPAVITTCYNCGHCSDLRGCPGGCADPNALLNTRTQIHNFLSRVFNS